MEPRCSGTHTACKFTAILETRLLLPNSDIALWKSFGLTINHENSGLNFSHSELTILVRAPHFNPTPKQSKASNPDLHHCSEDIVQERQH